MNASSFLSELCALPGLPGHESASSEMIARAFTPFCDEVWIDRMFNTIGRRGDRGPKVLLSAHQDEIGLVVTRIDARGFLHFSRNGGVDPRILPGLEVRVRGREDVYGVVGAKAPHLLQPKERDKAYSLEDLSIDCGMDEASVRALVREGDMVTLSGPIVELEKGKLAGKTMDDRACVAMLLDAAERLKGINLNCQAFFMASVQEEVGTRGATVGTYAINPDINIAVDVAHGPTPDSDKLDTFPLDTLALACGPNLHPALVKRVQDVAKRNHIAFKIDPTTRNTGTDARAMQTARDGIPTVLIELPLKYMHTTVELLDPETLREGGRLIAAFLAELDATWEEWLCF